MLLFIVSLFVIFEENNYLCGMKEGEKLSEIITRLKAIQWVLYFICALLGSILTLIITNKFAPQILYCERDNTPEEG
ncbi:MAG: hypothetical protein K2H01_00160 [Ruminococcus sp.]|nr:hypothetical protein [Ruminococcus sp.]